MSNKKNLREFNFEESILVLKCESALVCAVRDYEQLAEMGYTSEKREALGSVLDAFKQIATDDFMLGRQITKTQEKEAARQALEKSLRSIFTIAENVFGADTGKYKQFGNTNLTRQTDDQLLRTAANAASTANALLSELQPEGVTPDIITALNIRITTLDSAIDAKITATREREILTGERIQKANELYRLLVRLCNIGKNIWYGVNQAKYNDYIIVRNSQRQYIKNGKQTDVAGITSSAN